MANFVTCTEHANIFDLPFMTTVFIKTNTSIQEFESRKPATYNPKAGDELGENALVQAAKVGNLPLVQHILILSSDVKKMVNFGDYNGWTPLFAATTNSENPLESLNVVKFLIKKGANVDMAPIRGTEEKNPTPLYCALEKTQNQGVAVLLLKKGANINPPLSLKGQKFLEQIKKIQEK